MDSIVERILTPRVALTFAEFFISYDITIKPEEFGKTYIENVLYPFLYKRGYPGFKEFSSKILKKE